MHMEQIINTDFSIFQGGWSYIAEEIKNAVSLLSEQENLNVLEIAYLYE